MKQTAQGKIWYCPLGTSWGILNSNKEREISFKYNQVGTSNTNIKACKPLEKYV
jgi:hypothetical protein